MTRDGLPRIPKLCRRKDGRYYVTDPHTKKPKYFNSSDPLGEYEDWRRAFLERIKSILSVSDTPKPILPGQRLSVAKLCEAYLAYSRTWYVKDGQPTSEVSIIEMMVRRLNAVAGSRPADKLRVNDLEAAQQRMIEEGLTRRSCNAVLHRVRRMAKWAFRKEVISGDTLQRILSVPAIPKGRTNAREKPAVQPVPLETVQKTLPHLKEVYRVMVTVQLYAAMRPGEIINMRPIEIDRSREPWEYTPEKYKTQHHHEAGDPRRRRIFLGSQARAVLAPWLDRCHDASQPLFRRPNGRIMSKGAYEYAIRKACQLAGVSHWFPNMLRHTMATMIRRKHGIEAAQDYLGHERPEVTSIYAERSHERSRKIAEEMG